MQANHTSIPEKSELGKKSSYDSIYNPGKLFPIPRASKRAEIGIHGALPFAGVDIWNHYEVSWLNEKGKPVAAVAEIIIGCDSENIIESKSMKLYFNSFNNTIFENADLVADVVTADLQKHLKTSLLKVKITPTYLFQEEKLFPKLDGTCIDELDVACSVYIHEPSYLTVDDESVSETLYSDLLKSNCLVTNQPDWGSVQITYRGKRINHEGLLRYLVSFRNDNEFHEQCIEKIFINIMQRCAPLSLTVYGRFTRRGGLDINADRTTEKLTDLDLNWRLYRQ
jgi:7-cyano-7-deazaguanine reductase